MSDIRAQAARELAAGPWAIDGRALAAMMRVVQSPIAEPVPIGADGSPWRARSESRAEKQGYVGIIPIFGVIYHRAGALSALFGGTSTLAIQRQLADYLTSSSVSSIVLLFDSPGGSVSGVPELAEAIRKAARVKPIVALSDTMMASAAFWLGSQASEVVTAPSGELGSVGILTAHWDVTQAMAQAGQKITLIASTKEKVEESPYVVLSDDARRYMQSEVDRYYEQFVADVAAGRKVTPSQVKGSFGQGRMLSPRAAVAVRAADRIATLDQILGELSTAKQSWQAEQAMLAGRLRQHARDYQASRTVDDIEAEDRERRLRLAEEEHEFVQAMGRN